MKLVRCDRCGKEVEVSICDDTYLCIGKNDFEISELNYQGYDTCDLCNSCYREFLIQLKG